LPGVPYSFAVSHAALWIAFMIPWSRPSTSSRDQERRRLFCDISRPDVATPPAFAALPGPYSTFASRNTFAPSRLVGMLAPSEIT
jgi:hypothetical protein